MSADADARHMRRALVLARARLGKVAPNPAVGCVIVKDGAVVGEGATAAGGRPHGEEIALEVAGEQAQGATVYITLEPCAQRSSGAKSCARRLIEAGVARVVIAVRDPHPRGAGLATLTEWGVPVALGVCEDEARALNAGFFCLVDTQRPLLVIGGDQETCDALFAPQDGETAAAALARLGQDGMTRVWAADEASVAAVIANGARWVRG